MLVCKNISIKSKEKFLIDSFTLNLEQNQIKILSAPSGYGKSTLLKYICGLKVENFEYKGQVFLNNLDITKYPTNKRDIGIIFQDDLLFPHMTIMQNLLLVSSNKKQLIRETLNYFSINHIENKMPSNLSGGEKSKISIIRAMLLEPKFILLDEPFNGLDMKSKNEMKLYIEELVKKKNIGILMVTHNKDDFFESSEVIYL